MKAPPLLLDSSSVVTQNDVLTAVPRGNVIACDFKIKGVEAWDKKPWGYESDRIVNIDHHAESVVLRREISSTNLAIEFVQYNGIAKENDSVVINHTDCDSVLSAAIVCGDVEPLPEFGNAAIAADHTGEVNAIADLLQALDAQRDYEFSLRNLRLLLAGLPIDERAKPLLENRHAKRASASELVNNGKFERQGGLAWAELDDSIDSEFFPALLPDAALIVTFSPRKDTPQKWNAKFRLGYAAPYDLWLPPIIQPFDKGFGGRWNAGSNKRGGGSALAPDESVTKIIANMSR